MAEQILIFSTAWCPDCVRAKKLLARHNISYQSIDVEEDAEARAFIERVTKGMHIIPIIVFPDGSILSEPSNAPLVAKLGIQI